MMLQNERYNRVFITLSLFVFYLISGTFIITLDIKFAGALFMIASISSLGYLLLFWLLTSKGYIVNLETWRQKELLIVSIIMGILYLIAALESDPTHGVLSMLFWISLISTLIFLYLQYRVRKKTSETIKKWSIFTIAFWSLITNITIALILIIGYTFEKKAAENGTLVVLEDEDFVMDLLAPVLFLMLLLFVFSWLIRQIKSIIRLKNEKTKTELLHLKSQVNPHFFFNTLNNLYGLVEEDSKKAQELILKLSDMMRYSIYEGQHDFVTIKEEVEYLKNYIELHKMRYHKKTDVLFNLHIQDETSKVMPLLFIILLENAFKHGVENLREDAYVHINMTIGSNDIHFAIENNFDVTELTEQPGIGIKNLKRRLELVYPRKHSLSFAVTGDVYKAQLTLQLV